MADRVGGPAVCAVARLTKWLVAANLRASGSVVYSGGPEKS